MAGIEVLVPGARVDEFFSAQIAGARLYFSFVLSQSLFGRKNMTAAFIHAVERMESSDVLL